jgi:Protein tyrosine and serine/threonine kinase
VRVGRAQWSDIQNEARVISLFLSQGSHTNIVRILGHGYRPTYYLYVIDMELCDTTLRKYLNYWFREDPIPFTVVASLSPSFVTRDSPLLDKMENVWTIALHISRGLEFMHNLGEVHRDLTPNNGIQTLVWFDNSPLFYSGQTVEAYRFRNYSRSYFGQLSYYSGSKRNRELSSPRSLTRESDIYE